MTEIVAGGDESNNDVILGDESSQQAISFKLAQAFYNEITGKSERIVEEYNPSFILTMENVQQLHQRIIQSTAQYNVSSANASFSVEYLNDSSERFSSIERFMAHAGTKGVAVEEVDISYRLLVILPQTNKPQEYRINIRLLSRCAKVEDMKEELKGLPVSIPLWQFEKKFTCRASVDFVDITVAHAFMSVIKNWTDCLETTDMNRGLTFVRPISKYLPAGCQYGLLALGSYLTYGLLNPVFESPTPETTAKFVLLAILLNFLIFKLGRFIGVKSERHLDQIYQQSYVNFSGADRKLAQNSSSALRTNVSLSLGYIILTLVLGVASSTIAAYLNQS